MVADDVLYLSAADLERVALDPAVAREAVAAAFRAQHAGQARGLPKQALAVGPGHAFQSMVAAWADRGWAGCKWLGTAPVPPGSGLPTVHAAMALNNHATGTLRAIMDGGVLTGVRTAALSALAAHHLARMDSRTLGFVGCGVQARAHLPALLDLLPGLTHVLASSRTRASAEALAGLAQAAGRQADVADAETVVRGSDVLVTSVPLEPGSAPFLDPAWIPAGAFVSSVDIGRPWLPQGLRALDLLAVDDHVQMAAYPPLAPGLGPAGSFDADLAELAGGAHPGRTAPAQRAMFIFRGVALADLAVAAAFYDAAVAGGIGTRLPR